MPVFRLTDKLLFPPAELARDDGLLCIGGDLSAERILMAYTQGIFPWFSQGDPILWWSPNPRLLLYPDQIVLSRSLKKKLRKQWFTVTMDTAFETVISLCAETRRVKGEGTWIVKEMIRAYSELHHLGFAHSVETWHHGSLVGGLYGISLGGSFFGESMFAKVSDASKTALYALCTHLANLDFDLIDCQVTTDHLLRMGAVEVPRSQFLKRLDKSMNKRTLRGKWTSDYTLEGV